MPPNPPAGDYVKYVIGGTIASDTWSIGICQSLTGLSGVPTPSQMNAAALVRLNGFNTAVWSLATSGLKLLNGAGVSLVNCKSYLYRGGVLSAQGTAAITPVPGTGSPGLPFYTAMCVSLLTDRPGRSGRGRLYLPATAAAVSATTGQFTTNLSGLATAVAGVLTAYGPDDNGYPGDPASVAAVVSNTHGLLTEIQSIRIDTLPDTQHGRTRHDTATSVYSATV